MGTTLIRYTPSERRRIEFEREMNSKGWEWDYEEGIWVKTAAQELAVKAIRAAPPKAKLILGAASLLGMGLLALFKRR